MRRWILALLALALIAMNDAAVMANNVTAACPGPCQLCP